MNKLIIALYLILTATVSFAQSEIHTTIINQPEWHPVNVQVITVDIHNLIAVCEMTFQDYNKLLDRYKYKEEDVVDMPGVYTESELLSGHGIYGIEKRAGYTIFSWTGNNDMIAKFKDELQKYYSGPGDKGDDIYMLNVGTTKYSIKLKGNHVGIKKEL